MAKTVANVQVLTTENTVKEWEERFRKDFKLPNNKVSKAIINAVHFCINQGFMEQTELRMKYAVYCCTKHNMIHHCKE